MGKIGVVMNPGSGHGLAARLEPWIRLRLGDNVFFEGAGIGLEADLWPVGEAIVRRQFREIMRAPLKLARDRAVVMDIEIDEPPKREKVRAFTMTISNTPMTGAHLLLAPG